MGFVMTVENHFPEIAMELATNADALAKETAEAWAEDAERRAPRLTGELAGSIAARRVGKGTWEVTAGADHSIYVEYGTSDTPAQPFHTPAGEGQRPVFAAGLAALFD